MSRRGIDASMLASAGSNIGVNIGGGIASLGKGVGGMLQSRADAKNRETQQAEVQKELQQFANDPAQLNALGQRYQSQGKNDVAKAFYEAAKQASTKDAAGKSQGLQGGLMAIQQAGARGIPLEQLKEGVGSVLKLGGTQKQITDAYQSGVTSAKGGKKDLVNVPAGGALVDRQTGEEVYRAPFKPEAGPKRGIKTVERDDGSIVVIDDPSGDVIQTIPPPGKGTGNQESSLQLIQQTTQLLSDITDLKDIGFTESGFIGGVSSAVPGMPAYDREKQLLTLRANLGFEQINEMKRLAAESGASGTGLGQISNIEFMSLQSTIDAIYPGMSKDAQIEALENIEKHLKVVQKLASGVASADAIDWQRPEYKARGYHKDPETGSVFYAPDGRAGTVYKLVDGKFVKMGG